MIRSMWCIVQIFPFFSQRIRVRLVFGSIFSLWMVRKCLPPSPPPHTHTTQLRFEAAPRRRSHFDRDLSIRQGSLVESSINYPFAHELSRAASLRVRTAFVSVFSVVCAKILHREKKSDKCNSDALCLFITQSLTTASSELSCRSGLFPREKKLSFPFAFDEHARLERIHRYAPAGIQIRLCIALDLEKKYNGLFSSLAVSLRRNSLD